MQKTNRTVSYSGPLADILKGFVEEKQAVGYKYQKSAFTLKRFDRFCISIGHDELCLTKELVLMWTEKQPHETENTRKNRISLMRLLGSYMVRIGYDAYVYPTRVDKVTNDRYIPHIFSTNELAGLFKQADNCKPHIMSPNRHRILPLLFRILYGCGLRISEALQLKVKDVLLDEGTLKILSSKFGKERLVPLCPFLSACCRECMQKVHFINNPEGYFFPSPYGGMFDEKTIYNYFRRFLWNMGISHGGRGNGPRLHDLRHTFAVHCLKRLAARGVDLSAALPFLSTYLGHTGLKSTQHYLRLTAELYPDIVSAVEMRFGFIIPDGGEL